MHLIQVPVELQALLVVALTYLVTEGLKIVSGWFHGDLSGAASVIAAGLVAAVLGFANALLALIPPEFEPIANAVMQLLIVLLSAMGVHRTLRRSKYS